MAKAIGTKPNQIPTNANLGTAAYRDSGEFAEFVSAPATAADTGTVGQLAVDASYIYVCTATNTWKRVAIATW